MTHDGRHAQGSRSIVPEAGNSLEQHVAHARREAGRTGLCQVSKQLLAEEGVAFALAVDIAHHVVVDAGQGNEVFGGEARQVDSVDARFSAQCRQNVRDRVAHLRGPKGGRDQ